MKNLKNIENVNYLINDLSKVNDIFYAYGGDYLYIENNLIFDMNRFESFKTKFLADMESYLSDNKNFKIKEVINNKLILNIIS